MIAKRKFIFKTMILGLLFLGITPALNADFGLGCPELVDATRAGVSALITSVKNASNQIIENTKQALLRPLNSTLAKYSQYGDMRFITLVATSGVIATAGSIYVLAKAYNAKKESIDKKAHNIKQKQRYYPGMLALCAGIAGILLSKQIIAAIDSYLS